jgi:hypothetical protein
MYSQDKKWLPNGHFVGFVGLSLLELALPIYIE